MGKFAMQPEKSRLEDRGLIKDKDEAQVKKMNNKAAASALETKLELRPNKATLEAKGKIKDKEAFEAQKAEKAKTQAALQGALSAQHGAGANVDHGKIAKLRASFQPREKAALCKEVFDKHAPSGGVMALDGPEFRAALKEVSSRLNVPLNIDAIVNDAQAELDVPPDLEGFMECLDVVETLID